MRWEKRLVARELEVFSDGTFRMTSVERDQQLVSVSDLRAIADTIPQWLAVASGYLPVSTRTDTVVRIGEWTEAGDSLVFRISNVGVGERVAERFGIGDPALERELDSLVHQVLEERPVLGVARLMQGRMIFVDEYLDQEIVMTRNRRW